MITNKVILNIDVFGLTMKLWVMNKSNVALIVIEILQFTEIKKSLHDFLLNKSPSKSTSKYMFIAY
jgi:hypothetical protein